MENRPNQTRKQEQEDEYDRQLFSDNPAAIQPTLPELIEDDLMNSSPQTNISPHTSSDVAPQTQLTSSADDQQFGFTQYFTPPAPRLVNPTPAANISNINPQRYFNSPFNLSPWNLHQQPQAQANIGYGVSPLLPTSRSLSFNTNYNTPHRPSTSQPRLVRPEDLDIRRASQHPIQGNLGGPQQQAFNINRGDFTNAPLQIPRRVVGTVIPPPQYPPGIGFQQHVFNRLGQANTSIHRAVNCTSPLTPSLPAHNQGPRFTTYNSIPNQPTQQPSNTVYRNDTSLYGPQRTMEMPVAYDFTMTQGGRAVGGNNNTDDGNDDENDDMLDDSEDDGEEYDQETSTRLNRGGLPGLDFDFNQPVARAPADAPASAPSPMSPSTAGTPATPATVATGGNYVDDPNLSFNERLVGLRSNGVQYKEIQQILAYTGALDTLRGLHRTLTKPPNQRPRKPQWPQHAVRALLEAVVVFGGFGSIDDVQAKHLDKIPWARIAEWMEQQRGCHRYGNGTVKRRFRDWLKARSARRS